MNDIALSRVDFRLIHGQVVTKWLKAYPAKKIVIVDDTLAEDEFMADIYMLAAPAGVKVEIFRVNEAKAKIGQDGKSVFLLFKNIADCYRLFQEGFRIPKLVIGGVPSDSGKKIVFNGVYLNKEENDWLNEMAENGTKVIFSSTPDDSYTTLSQIAKKFE